MFQALVVGNGESRKHINLNKFKSTHTLFGCNAIHRDIIVNHLVCCDRRMVSEALTNPNNIDTIIYVRNSFYNFFKKNSKNISQLPLIPKIGELKRDQPDHWGSGSYAILLAAVMGYQKIDLVGFDLYPIEHKVNNIYKDSNNYSKSNSQGVDPAYWIYHAGEIFLNYPTINFTIYNQPDWKVPQEWKRNNVQFRNITQLEVDSINSSVVQ